MQTHMGKRLLVVRQGIYGREGDAEKNMVKYRTRIVTFPEEVVRGASVQNKDGSFTFYVDSKLGKEERAHIIAKMVSSLEREAAQNG